MFEDPHGRAFYYLRLSITEMCNFRCTYCLPNGYEGPKPSAFLSRPELRRVMAAFASQGTRKIRLTGGEPVLRNDLPGLIFDARSQPGIEHVAITTNGYRLPKVLPDWASAGLQQINISMDSLDPKQFQAITGHDRLRELLDGLYRALDMGFEVKVNAVWMRGVNNRLGPFLEWIRDLPITLRFIEVMETGAQPDFHERYFSPLNDVRQQLQLEGWQRLERPIHAGPAQEFRHPDFAGRIGLIMPYSPDFCTTCNRLRVTAQGQLHLCLFGENGYDLRPWLQRDNQQEELVDTIREAVGHKKASHGLHEHNPGLTRTLSMLGG